MARCSWFGSRSVWGGTVDDERVVRRTQAGAVAVPIGSHPASSRSGPTAPTSTGWGVTSTRFGHDLFAAADEQRVDRHVGAVAAVGEVGDQDVSGATRTGPVVGTAAELMAPSGVRAG
jgi:hypothetical protein